MKSHMITTFLVALVLILHSHIEGAQGIRLLLGKTGTSTSGLGSSSQSLKGLHVKEKNPYKKEKSSFRRIPPSRSNPTQNKSKPP
ncbi:hypothetical protein CDL12_13642 [Handroanthus impetiginosus]|uniref:Uncharacterized protein n=1 Tax=Handroanthus impetiginosus TaxID=429701 RepID=A0A2G9H8B0_9LAMI|nr:hypothetical protein CDL12_13642 [Handroanthus impetiginosus]